MSGGERPGGGVPGARLLALSTVARSEDAERIARALVERGLAACVNVVAGVVSVYRWKGEVERDDEILLVIKTRAEAFPALRDALVALHPYEVPELIALPIEAGHAPYLAWLDESTRGDEERGKPSAKLGRRQQGVLHRRSRPSTRNVKKAFARPLSNK